MKIMLYLLIILTQSLSFGYSYDQLFNAFEHIFFMEPNVVINQTLYSMCLESSLDNAVNENSLDLSIYPGGVVYSHLKYFQDNTENSNNIEIDEYNPLRCSMILKANIDLRVQIIFEEFNVPHYQNSENEVISCDDSLIIAEALDHGNRVQKVERILKLCGDSVESLSKISLNGNKYYRSLTNNVIIKWQPKQTKGRGFKALFTIVKPIIEEGGCNLDYYVQCDEDICIPKDVFCNDLNICKMNYNNYETICSNAFNQRYNNNSKSLFYFLFSFYLKMVLC